MAEQHKKILSALGLSKEQIDKLESMTTDELKELKVEDFTSPVKTNFQTQFLNDDAFLEAIPEEKTSKAVKKKIESSQYARFMNELKDVAKEMGIDFDDLSAEDQKSIKGFYRQTQNKALSKAGSNTALVELQGKLSEALAAKTSAEAGTEKKVNEAVEATTKKLSAKLEKAATLSILNGNTTVKPEYVVDGVIAKAKEKYAVPFNAESMVSEIKQKKYPELDVTRNDGTLLTYKDAIIDILKEDGLYKEPAKEKEEAKKVTVEVDGDKSKPVIPEYILKNMNAGLKEETAKAV